MITITQTCDGCGRQRELKSVRDAQNQGWREVYNSKELCTECIRKALSIGETE
jgi:hypothetical protein